MSILSWAYPSSSGGAVYRTQLDTDSGLLSCNCRGWTFKRGDGDRFCKHTTDVRSKVDIKNLIAIANGKKTLSHDANAANVLTSKLAEKAAFVGGKPGDGHACSSLYGVKCTWCGASAVKAAPPPAPAPKKYPHIMMGKPETVQIGYPSAPAPAPIVKVLGPAIVAGKRKRRIEVDE